MHQLLKRALLHPRADKRLVNVITLCLLLVSCGDSAKTGALLSPQATTATVRATSVTQLTDAQTLRFAGVTRVRQRATLTFQVSGVLSVRAAELGMTVSAGQELARLRNPGLQPAELAATARVEQLREEQAQAARESERLAVLYERGVLSRQELEQQQSRVDALQAAVDNARASLQQAGDFLTETTLFAPFDGYIEAVLIEPGEFVQAGQPVLRMSATSGLEVEIRAPAEWLSALTTGQAVSVWSSLDAMPLTGIVQEIGRTSTNSSALYPLVVGLPENSILTGQSVEIALSRPGSQTLAVPLSAVMRSAQGLSVFQITNNQVRRLPVQIKELQGEFAVIQPGALTVGDQVVYSGLTRLTDGDSVEILP